MHVLGCRYVLMLYLDVPFPSMSLYCQFGNDIPSSIIKLVLPGVTLLGQRHCAKGSCGHTGDRPYLVSGADDKLAKVWDYQTKACVQTLEGHSHNVSAVCFHPELPVILTGCSFTLLTLLPC